MKGRNSQFARIHKILTLLEQNSYGLAATDIYNKLVDRGFDVNKRTVYRDLDALKQAGFPLEEKGKTDDQGTRWVMSKDAKINHYLTLSSQELWSLYLAKMVLAPLEDTPLYDNLMATFDKIEDTLGGSAKRYLEELNSELHFDSEAKWGIGLDSEIIETVRAGCAEGQLLKVTYKSANAGTTRERVLGPAFLYYKEGSLYLVAEDMESNTHKTFSVTRIKAATLMEDVYDKPPVTPDEYFANSFGVFRGGDVENISLSFSPKIASYISERKWHSSQESSSDSDGALTLKLRVSITPELVRWILGFGTDVKVESPASLIQKLRDEVESMGKLY